MCRLVCVNAQSEYGRHNRVASWKSNYKLRFFDRLPFAQTYLCICCLRISSYMFCPDEDTKYEHKMHVQLWMTLDYRWFVYIKCNGVIQNVGADVSEKHFRTKSVSALHPILPVYFNILSPGIGTYSNFEIVSIIFELKKIGWVTTKRWFSIEETYFSALNWEIHVYL